MKLLLMELVRNTENYDLLTSICGTRGYMAPEVEEEEGILWFQS